MRNEALTVIMGAQSLEYLAPQPPPRVVAILRLGNTDWFSLPPTPLTLASTKFEDATISLMRSVMDCHNQTIPQKWSLLMAT